MKPNKFSLYKRKMLLDVIKKPKVKIDLKAERSHKKLNTAESTKKLEDSK
jgi:hypothetical protein